VATKAPLFIKNGATGTVHIRILLLDESEGATFDSITFAVPAEVVEIEHVGIVGLTGNAVGYHARMIQNWAGTLAQRIDRLYGTSNLQERFIPPSLSPPDSQPFRTPMWPTTDRLPPRRLPTRRGKRLRVCRSASRRDCGWQPPTTAPNRVKLADPRTTMDMDEDQPPGARRRTHGVDHKCGSPRETRNPSLSC